MRSEVALARLSEVAERARPVALAREQVLPVIPPLEAVLPQGLRRGSTVSVTGSSLALAAVAGPLAAGSWGAIVGWPSVGLASAAELGVPLQRVVLVASPPADQWATVVATLVDAFDVVLVRVDRRVAAQDARRLSSRARERGAVLVVGGTWPEGPDIRLAVTAAEWQGLGDGHGHLRVRRVTVEASGRRAAARPRRTELWLPAVGGGVAVAEPRAEVRVFRRKAG